MPWDPARLIALSGPILFVFLIGLEHLVRPDLSPRTNAVSDYGRGAHSWLFVMSLLALAAAKFATAYRITANGALDHVGIALVVLDGIATLVVAAARTDVEGTTTLTGTVHQAAAGVAFVAGCGAFLALSSNMLLRGQEHGPPLLGVAIATVAALAWFGALLLLHRPFGLSERILLLLIATWLSLNALLRPV